jgi:16S rRNA processing protein RimM
LKAIFVEERKESFIPWFIESTRIKNEEEIHIKIEGINSKEQGNPAHAERCLAAGRRLQKIRSQNSAYQSAGL